ncbi:GAF domain-containing protein [Actinomadura chokoriensis]|uniref:GAF domain-containing protein n=1 Tax=Actinomadura chokoriensis TaxID=454156 RepID=A0ABV4R601_9ACTN
MSHEPLYEPAGHLLTPVDHEVPQRVARLRSLGLGQWAEPEFDAFARDLAETARRLVGTGVAPFAMVNFVTDRQFLAGLYAPPDPGADPAGAVELGREIPLDHGYCPHVVVRRKALVLDDICDYPRFAGNPVVDKLGIRTYVGAPLIDRTGTTLGTICVVDREPRPWGRPGLNLIKERAAELVRLIGRREESLG